MIHLLSFAGHGSLIIKYKAMKEIGRSYTSLWWFPCQKVRNSSVNSFRAEIFTINLCPWADRGRHVTASESRLDLHGSPIVTKHQWKFAHEVNLQSIY